MTPRRVLARFSVGDLHIEDRSITAPISGGAQTLTDALRSLDEQGIKLRDVGLRRPTLDDVFLSLTGDVTESGSAREGVDRDKELVTLKEAS